MSFYVGNLSCVNLAKLDIKRASLDQSLKFLRSLTKANFPKKFL